MAKKVKKQKLAKAIGQLGHTEGDEHRRKLRKSMNAAVKAGDMQAARSFAYQLAREDGASVRKGASETLARVGFNDQAQASAILRASSPAIRNAQRRPDRGAGNWQRATLRSAYSGDYVAESPDESETLLESQRRIVEAERDLRKARTPEAREAAAHQLTRWKLIDGHRRGEI